MPKIRGVHPDIWTDEDFVELSPFARLLWLGMWNYACDNGHLADRSKQIKMRILPTDDVNAAELLRELEANGRIIRSNGWITVPNFSKRQRPDKRFWVVCDAPGCTKPDDPKRETRSAPTEPPQRPHAPTPRPPVDGEGDGEGELKVIRTPSRKRSETPDRFDEFWNAYNKKRGRKAAEAKYRLALKRPGVTPDLLIAAAIDYIAWQNAEGKHPTFTKDPATWLTGEHWTDERIGRAQPQTRVQSHMALVQQLAQADPTIPQIGPRS